MKLYMVIRRNWRFKPLMWLGCSILFVMPSKRLALRLGRLVGYWGHTITFTDKDPGE